MRSEELEAIRSRVLAAVGTRSTKGQLYMRLCEVRADVVRLLKERDVFEETIIALALKWTAEREKHKGGKRWRS